MNVSVGGRKMTAKQWSRKFAQAQDAQEQNMAKHGVSHAPTDPHKKDVHTISQTWSKMTITNKKKPTVEW